MQRRYGNPEPDQYLHELCAHSRDIAVMTSPPERAFGGELHARRHRSVNPQCPDYDASTFSAQS